MRIQELGTAADSQYGKAFSKSFVQTWLFEGVSLSVDFAGGERKEASPNKEKRRDEAGKDAPGQASLGNRLLFLFISVLILRFLGAFNWCVLWLIGYWRIIFWFYVDFIICSLD